MASLVSNRPACRTQITVTPVLEARVLDALHTASQQWVARELRISKTTVSRIARSQAKGGAHG